jgi:2-(1,2-epoxy-1,2-dihydrophenyl)acetyl-CoA isomerase
MKEFEYNTLTVKLESGLGSITLNRPEVYNAFNDEMSYELQDALKMLGRDQECRVLVITGEGKAFCSGQDLKASSDSTEKRNLGESLHKRYNPIIRAMRKMPKPIICRLNGVAAGAGCSLALACDLIIASEHAKLIEVFVNVGLVLDSGSSYFLPRAVGSVRAFEMATMGTHIKASQALEWGMVNEVVAAEELDAAVGKYVDYYRNAPTMAIGLMKKMLNKAGNADLDEMLDYEAYAQEIAGNSHDHKEGVAAFIEKRRPGFKGS